MKLPDNSLGITDAMTWHECPARFHAGLRRFTDGERDRVVAGHYTHPLAYGQALHTAAQVVVQNPQVYLEDAVDAGWSEWSHLLQPEHYQELKADVQALIDRTLEAPNLELVAAEQEMRVPMFVGTPQEGSDEEEAWYYYRFRIDALYRDKDDPGHYVVRDFKSYRRQRWQHDVDADMQFTAYAFGVHEAFPDVCERVTIWVDQPKFRSGELFTYRTKRDLQAFREWWEATVRAILKAPEEWVAQQPILNDHCAWCPLLPDCEVLQKCIDYEKAIIEARQEYEAFDKESLDLSRYVMIYEAAKAATKTLKAFCNMVSDDLKWSPGVYAGREYVMHQIPQKKIPADKAFEILGAESLRDWPALPLKLKEMFPEYAERLSAIESATDGYDKLTSRKAPRVDGKGANADIVG